MAATVRQSTSEDATSWLDLLKSSLGEDHPAEEVYDPNWAAGELGAESGAATWVAEDVSLQASATILPPLPGPANPVCNLGRLLFRPESFENGAGTALLKAIVTEAEGHQQVVITRVLASDNSLQVLLEKEGFVCIGFQPFKHLHRQREGVLFYVHPGGVHRSQRAGISESLPQVLELANAAIAHCKIDVPEAARDGVTGYPLKTELAFAEAPQEDYDLWKTQSQSSNPPTEISGSFNLGFGYMRLMTKEPVMKTGLGQREGRVVGGLMYYYDEEDRCIRIIDGFCTDDLSMGAMLQDATKLAQDQFSSVYVEMDVLVTAPRLLKSAEQIGFVPVAYLPSFHVRDGRATDVVKLVKLNTSYALENTSLTTHATSVVKVVDYNFQDLKIGVAIINLLRGLPIFEGLGDGELRKIARLFTQKLFRPGERVFNKGDVGNEAYIVMRGQIDILLEENTAPIASVGSGQIFGEQAFLDGSARGGLAVANQASILLVIQRTAMNDLVQREPHLGMVVMRNVAMDLSNKLRRANTALTSRR